MEEVWKVVQGHPKYKISSKGRIWSDKTNKFLKLDGGLAIMDGEVIGVPTLMGQHFLDGYNQSKFVLRKNKDIRDWSVDNIYLADMNEYQASSKDSERIKNGWAKKYGIIIGVKDDKRVKARTTREIAALTGVPKSSVAYCLKNGTTSRTGWFFFREKEGEQDADAEAEELL